MKIFVTDEHMKQMRAHVATLTAQLAEIRLEKHASYQGDTNTWHDNFAYESLTRQEKLTEEELFSAKKELDSYVVLSRPDVQYTGAVGLFCHVRLLFENTQTGTTDEKEISIVPLGAQDYPHMIYNYNAPMILPLIGATTGNERTVRLPSGVFNVTVLSVVGMD